MQGRTGEGAIASRRSPGRRPLPWNETSKPAQKPGPWDAPAQGERETAGGAAPAPSGGSRGSEGSAKRPPRKDSASPWGTDQPSPKLSAPRRLLPAEPKKATAPTPRGPHLDELGRQLRTRLAHVALRASGRAVRLKIIGGALGIGLGAWALSGVYWVDVDQTGMVTRLGAFVGETGPGLHYHLPYPVETVRQLPVGAVNRLDAGFTSDGAAGQMLTRDGNLVDLYYTVEWRIADPVKYLFRFAEPDATLRRTAEAAMRRAIGRVGFADVATPSRGGAPLQAAGLMQAELDRAGAGVTILGVQVRDAQPPDAAQAGFHDLVAARADAAAAARDAEAYRGRVVAEAKGEVAKAVQTSQGYRDQEISEARGEADRFALVDAQYRKAPEVTRDRLYTETMERVLHNANKVVVQTPKGGASQIVLPPELFRTKPSDAPAQGGAPPSPANSQGASQAPAGGDTTAHAAAPAAQPGATA